MPHFKCVACRTRLYSAAAVADLLSDRCPRCGSPFEPVGELAEIVGFQSITPHDGDAGHGFSPEAVAQAVALPIPEENP
jgi:hypothetical protein